MKREDWQAAYGPIPDALHTRVSSTLSQLDKEEKVMKRTIIRTLALALCAALAVTFLTEPKTAENAPAEKARTHNNDYVDYFQRIQKKEAQQGRSVDNPVVIISTSMEPATGQISYQVQLLDGMTDWEKERILSRYSMNIANMEVFYPQEGDIHQEMDVPHLRFRAVSSTSAPPIDPAYDDLVAPTGVKAPPSGGWASPCCWTMRRTTPAETPYPGASV